MQTPTRPLPRGRHRLPREQVVSSQRTRMLRGMAEAMMEKGYVNTTVADVIARAGVSRETFYQQFSAKADCFMAAFDAAAGVLIGGIEAGTDLQFSTVAADDERDAATRLDQFDKALRVYLDTLAEHPATARLFLVEVYAAGPAAIHRRMAVQQRIVAGVAAILGVPDSDTSGRFACEVLVAAVSTMVTEPLVSHDPTTLRDLHAPLMRLVRSTVLPGPATPG